MSSVSENLLPKRLGDFEILRQIGRGGMGIVYEAQQRSLNRRVALKVLSSGLGLTAKAVMRFRHEAEAAAKLHHTNIVPIYATGDDQGVHFYAMELVEGPSLDVVIRDLRQQNAAKAAATVEETSGAGSEAAAVPGWVHETIAFQASPNCTNEVTAPSSPASGSGSGILAGAKYFDKVAAMLADVAEALEHAHNQGVIHRDVKPSNLLLSPVGRVSINDFGLARILEQPGMTMTGEFVGSPLYMSPEQIAAGRVPIDHRTDIYSLGATMYELLTLQPPFPGQQRDQVIAQVLHKEVVPPRRKNKKVPVDLDTICLKALEKDPDRRYRTAGQMAADLRSFVNRFAISAKRVGPIGRAFKWARRNRAVAALLLLLVVASGIAGGLAYKIRLDELNDREAQIEKAKDTLLWHAMSGEFDEARGQLAAARELGAPAGQLLLMKAQLDLLEGNDDDVVTDLEKAEHQLGGSTSAYAMLTNAYLGTGREQEHIRRLDYLIDLPAREYQDRLLKGWAEIAWAPGHAADDLEQALHQRKSLVATLMHADALTWRAAHSPSPGAAVKDVQLALQNIRAVRTMLTDDKKPWPVASLVLATIIEADLLAKTSTERAEERLNAIEQDVELLAQWQSENYYASFTRACYLRRVGRLDDFFADFKEKPPKSPFAHAYYVAELFRAGRDNDALNAFDRMPEQLRSRVGFMRTFIEMSLPNANRDLIAKNFLAQQRSSMVDGRAENYLDFEVWVLQLLGEGEQAQKLARERNEATRKLGERWPIFKAGSLASGELREEQLIEACSRDRSALIHAHFAIAVDKLAKGDRALAEHHFREVLKTDQFYRYVYPWSEAFLKRLKDDPNWLPWLKAAVVEGSRPENDERLSGVTQAKASEHSCTELTDKRA